ncbi:hypothetical protein ACUVCC_000672 [Citrobacter freundii]
MTALNKQALRQLATDAHELGIINRYTKGIEANKRFAAIATPLTFLALLNELESAEKRIAELEARKFKVEMPESFYPDGDIDAPLAVDELEVIAAIVEASGKPVAFCKRCDREVDLTHRPDGSHYCHAPAAVIGVKGE